MPLSRDLCLDQSRARKRKADIPPLADNRSLAAEAAAATLLAVAGDNRALHSKVAADRPRSIVAVASLQRRPAFHHRDRGPGYHQDTFVDRWGSVSSVSPYWTGDGASGTIALLFCLS